MNAAPTGTNVRIEEVQEVTDELLAALGELSSEMLRARAAPTAQDITNLLQSPATRLLIARDPDGPIIGTLTLVTYQLPSGARFGIEDVAVLPFAGRRGLGSALLAEATRLIQQAG